MKTKSKNLQNIKTLRDLVDIGLALSHKTPKNKEEQKEWETAFKDFLENYLKYDSKKSKN